ncbi:ribosomal protein S5 domain 2-type protein [Syncephalis pseudoplumigaleata]|uniref:Ribosomal RNA-processing protein 42 n=1 Tax=Syncephalis pseudoplumigaleata TaxID=1712513 RepID=A0A4P9Z5J0_9FUNG|nr:ribosomal protein S5 domain 2-type protein [Syncephalis pseudoplumigaleata]|eukprot:RKP27785.1 ribosomal protein S5 domain 2-type protein [Syncephalis pseudoplumigaleata]
MSLGLISVVERDFVERGVDLDLRTDGRGRNDYRLPRMEMNLVAQSDGSARCQLGGSTDVLVSIRCELGQPEPTTGDRGRLAVSVECAPSASQQLEGRGADELNTELAEALSRALTGPRSGLNLRQLCIVENMHCWILNIDAIVLDLGGNVLDALLYAARAALADTRVPGTQVQSLDEGVDFEVDDDINHAAWLEHASNVPLCVTAYKIGAGYVLDATLTEELCSSARLHVSVNPAGQVCAAQKNGYGSIEPSLLITMLQAAKEKAMYLLEVQEEQIQQHKRTLLEKQTRGESVKRPSIFM